MKPRVSLFLVMLLFAVPAAFAQTVKIGNDVQSTNGGDVASSETRTDISLDPATAGGRINSVTVYWSDAGCANAFAIQFFRRSGDVLTPTSRRGPFTATSNVMTVDITPIAGVEQGDLIGVVRTGNCGSPGTLSGAPTSGYLSYQGEVTAQVRVSDGQRVHSALAVAGSGPASDVIAAVIPAVGSVRGRFGSSFKTSLQLLNPTSSTLTGFLIFHPQGVPASFTNGRGYQYSIPIGQQVTVDLAEAFTGSAETPIGLGSLDVDVTAGQSKPQIIARVYNDAGTEGTAGFYEDPISLGDDGPGGRVISTGASAFMISPVDPGGTRFNIGVRTLFSGAELTAQLLDNSGLVLAHTTKTYPPTYFEQVDASSFFGGVPVGASKIIKITVSDGSAIVYGATTDNVTNDPSVQYAIAGPATQ